MDEKKKKIDEENLDKVTGGTGDTKDLGVNNQQGRDEIL